MDLARPSRFEVAGAAIGVTGVAQQFTRVQLDPKQCRTEIDEFGDLLQAKAELSEKHDIQPFFKARVQVSAFIGSFMRNIGPATQICFEYISSAITPPTWSLATRLTIGSVWSRLRTGGAEHLSAVAEREHSGLESSL